MPNVAIHTKGIILLYQCHFFRPSFTQWKTDTDTWLTVTMKSNEAFSFLIGVVLFPFQDVEGQIKMVHSCL